MRKAVEDRDKLVEEAKELQGKLDAASSEILRLNGVIQGHIDLIGEVFSSSESSEG